MPEDIFSREYWTGRIRRAHKRREIHRSVFELTKSRCLECEIAQEKEIAKYLEVGTSILDVGCGFGRLFEVLPEWWDGEYLGVDFVPEFLSLARKYHPTYQFIEADVRTLKLDRRFDLGVCLSFKPMVIRNVGIDVWKGIRANLLKYCSKLLYLEMDPESKGEIDK